MEAKVWYDVVAFEKGCRDIIYSTQSKEDAEGYAYELKEKDNSVGIVITVNRMKNNSFKRLENIIVNNTKEVSKHFDFLKSIDDGLMTKKDNKKKKKHIDGRTMKKEYHF